MKILKLINIVSLSSLLLISCSKGNHAYSMYHPPLPVEQTHSKIVDSKKDNMLVVDSGDDYVLWAKFLSEKAGNLAFSELIAKSIFYENKKYILNTVAPLTLDEIQELIKEIEQHSQILKKDLTFYDSKYKMSNSYYEKTILFFENKKYSEATASEQLLINSTSKLKTDLLKNILSTYDQRIAKNAENVALYILNEVAINYPDAKIAIEKSLNENPDNLKDILFQTLNSLKIVDQLFKNSDLSYDEQLASLCVGVVGIQAFNKLKDKKSFQEVLKDIAVVSDVFEKAKEIKSLLYGINQYQGEMRKDWQEFGKAMNKLSNDSSNLWNNTSNSGPQSTQKKMKSMMYHSLFDGFHDPKNLENTSLLSTKIALKENLADVLNKAQKLNNNVLTIMNSTQVMAKILKIDLPKDVKKVMNVANKANGIFSLVNSTLKGLKNGGVMGALGALSSGPMMGIMGLDSDPDAEFKGEVLTQLGFIDQKLDNVISLQKQSIDLQKEAINIQLESMTMIKDMAIMIDEYHREEMNTLFNIQDIAQTNLEISKVGLNKGLKTCEQMLAFQLNDGTKLTVDSFSSYKNMQALDLDIQKLKKSLNTFRDFEHFISSTEQNGWSKCQEGINDAFGVINLKENPIRHIYNSHENENLYRFQRERYAPLFRFLSLDKLSSVLYHLPLLEFKSLPQKINLLKNEDISENDSLMEDFISTRALERYTSQLLVFYPFIHLDRDEWKSGLKGIMEISMNNSKSDKSFRANYLLRNNLTLIQAAIAQEALFSGELILEKLIFEQKNLFEGNITVTSELAYAVVNNRLLMTNLLKYMILKTMGENSDYLNIVLYKDAFDSKDIRKMEKFFENELVHNKIALDNNGQFVFKIKVDNNEQTFLLPTPTEFQDNRILYSENMYSLLELQKRVMEALSKVGPNNYSDTQKEKMARMMIFL
jgi:hypothetical protein